MSKNSDLSLSLVAAEIDRDAKSYELTATANQLADLSERFDLVALNSLVATVSISRKGHDEGILIEGQVKADLIQRCIASLADVPEVVDVPFSLLLVDPETADRMDADESYLDAEQPEYDALEGDTVEVGEVVAQTVAISMNPYPRAEGIELSTGNKQGVSFNEPELEKKNPFAVLGKLKDES